MCYLFNTEVKYPMIEAITKISGIFKASIIPLLFLGITHSVNKEQIKEDRSFRIDDKAPGDNFPHIVIPREF
jgi:hypothetical protein